MANPFTSPMVEAARIKKYFTRFENAGAVNPENAKTLQSLGLDGGFLFNRLIHSEVFIETSEGVYYINRQNYEKFKSARRLKALVIVGGIVLLVLVISYFL
jgi:hypothetical protein